MNPKVLCLFVMSLVFVCACVSSSSEENDNERAVRQILENPRIWASGRALYLVNNHARDDLSAEDKTTLEEYRSFFMLAQNLDVLLDQEQKPRVAIRMGAVDKKRCSVWCRPKAPTDKFNPSRENLFYCLVELANQVFSAKTTYQVRTLHVSWTGEITFGIQPGSH